MTATTWVAKPFTPARFTPTKHESAEDKARFANKFARYVRARFERQLFHQSFYKRLCTIFGHIAHMNLQGFYEHWFATQEAQLAFIQHVLGATPVGRPNSTWADVETALQEWMRTSGILETARTEVAANVERSERALLARLLEKYPDAYEVKTTDTVFPHRVALSAQADLMEAFVGSAGLPDF